MVATEDYLPLWLEVHVEAQAWLFELRAGEDRAVVVGSHPSADVCLVRGGVASTHFHFEREGDAVVVVPGYRAALIIDHVPAPEPVVLAKTARVEFCGRVLEASIHDVPPLDMLLEARQGTDRMVRRPDYFERLPGDTDPTAFSLAAVAPAEVVRAGAAHTTQDDAFDFLTTGTFRSPTPSEPLGPQGTLIMRRPVPSEPTPATPEPLKPPSLPPIAPTARLRLEPWTATPYSPESSPTKVEVPRPNGSTRSPAAGREPASAATPAESTVTPSLAPTERPVVASKAVPSAIEQLGLAASRRPLRVAAAALPICAVFALALVGAARLTGRAHVVSAAQSVVVVASRPSSIAPPKSNTPPTPIVVPPVPVAIASSPAAPLSASPAPSSAPASPTPTAASRPSSVRPSKHVFLGR